MKSQMAQWTLALTLLACGWWFGAVIVPAELKAAGHGQGLVSDLYPTWNAARSVIHGENPYTDEAAEKNQFAIFGRTIAGQTWITDQERFAYPLFSTFPFIPLTFVSFSTADKIVFWCFLGLSMATLWLWVSVLNVRMTPILFAVVMASFPVILGIVWRQPTVLYLFFLALAVWAAKSGHFVSCGILNGLLLGKPQFGIFLFIPLFIWLCRDWKGRRHIAFGFAASGGALVITAFVLQPGWLTWWLHNVAVYNSYAGPSLAHVYNLPLILPVVLWLWNSKHKVRPYLVRRLGLEIAFSVLFVSLALMALACFNPGLWYVPLATLAAALLLLICVMPLFLWLE